jgi:hypothetical protein
VIPRLSTDSTPPVTVACLSSMSRTDLYPRDKLLCRVIPFAAEALVPADTLGDWRIVSVPEVGDDVQWGLASPLATMSLAYPAFRHRVVLVKAKARSHRSNCLVRVLGPYANSGNQESWEAAGCESLVRLKIYAHLTQCVKLYFQTGEPGTKSNST